MYKIAGKIIDISDDPRFMEDPEFRARFDPIMSWEKHASMPRSSFALVLRGVQEHPKYPVHNKTACAVSTGYFKRAHREIHPVFQVVAATHLKAACERYGLEAPEEVKRLVSDKVRSNVVDLRKMGADYADTAVPETAEGRFAKMAQWWLENERHMTLDEKNQKADRLVKEAAELNLSELHPRIASYATKDQIGSYFKRAVEIRAQICDKLGKPDAATEYRELPSDLAPTMAKEAVERLFVVDEKYGLNDYYTRIADPYRAVYGARPEEYWAKKAREDDKALRYKLDTIVAECGGHPYTNIEGLSLTGSQQFRQDPYGTYMSWPKPLQDYVLAKFDRQLRDAKLEEAGLSGTGETSDKELKKRTENLRSGRSEYHDLHKVQGKGLHATVENVPIVS